jgi:hypothetical protein
MIKQETREDTEIVGLRDSLQKLSFDQLIQDLGMMKLKLGIIIPIIFEKGKEEGFNEIEIRNKVKKAIDIPERTLNRYLPDGAKQHKYPKNRELAKLANYNEITEDSTSTKTSNSEPVLNVLVKSVQKSECVYRDWTLEELIAKYEETVLENEYLDLQLTEANTRINELEEYLEEQGLMIND